MSIKLYSASRVPINKLNDFLEDIRKQIVDQTAAIIFHYMKRLKIEVVVGWLENEKYTVHPDMFIHWLYMKFVDQIILPATRSLNPSPFDLSSWLWVYIDGRYAYILYNYPHYLFSDVVYAKLTKYTQDFCYWNNTDKPEEVTSKEWNKRRKKWDYLLKVQPLRYDLVSFEMGNDWEIMDKVRGLCFSIDK